MNSYKFKFSVKGKVSVKGDGHCKGNDINEAYSNARSGIAKQLSVNEEAVFISSLKTTK
ncbi:MULTISPECIES: hypothetical protein [Vibrio]|uniref:hypothetical protein n=1 Tax=Vibrio TaxID=662 RepID=UPI00037A0D8C|nr:hypothetical protein [Vibrio vulnificus]EJL6318819.1 hypothetical protein [Vibrio cholerae]ASC56525.1 not available [Vibrio vulnificus]EHV9836772.1 hypothetical protein [Vibrio vulnificus]EJL6703261.1 hypothetical protein [Vibrio cholerae]EKF9069991.1 hypothetical protein [Vibrio cholerae]